MNDAALMAVVNRVAHLCEELQPIARREASLANMVENCARIRDILHREKRHTAARWTDNALAVHIRPDFINLRDGRMPQAGEQLGLVLETAQGRA